MIRLSLSAVQATFSNFNARIEKAGPDDVPAADLEWSVGMAAEKLDEIDPTMRPHLFDLKGLKDLAEGPALAHPNWAYPIKVDGDMTGATLLIDVGIGDPMKFTDVKVGSYRITPMEGGSVILGLRCQCKPDEAQAGKLYMLQGQKLAITVVPPALPVIAEGKGDGEKAPKPKRNKGPAVPEGATVQ